MLQMNGTYNHNQILHCDRNTRIDNLAENPVGLKGRKTRRS